MQIPKKYILLKLRCITFRCTQSLQCKHAQCLYYRCVLLVKCT